MDKEQWKNLSGKCQWDVTVALRGPDVKRSEVIKSFTTSVIRSCMSRIIRVGGQLSDYGFVLLPSGSVFKAPKQDPSQPVTFLRPDMDHFLGHVREAADILDIPIISVTAASWENIMLAMSPQEGMKRFLLLLKSLNEEIYVPPPVLEKIKELNEAYGISGGTMITSIPPPSEPLESDVIKSYKTYSAKYATKGASMFVTANKGEKL